MLKKEKKKKEKNNIFPIIYEVLLYIYMLFVPIFTIVKGILDDFNVKNVADTIMWFSIAVGIITLILFIIEIIKKKHFNFSNIKIELLLFVLFIIWCGISTCFSSKPQESLLGICARYCGFIQFLSYFAFGYLGFSLSDKGKIRFLRIFLIISTAIAILSILQHYFSIKILPLSNHETNITGIFYNSNHYGYYIVYSTIISMLLFIYEKNKIIKSFNFIIYILNIYMLIINNTFGCYVAVLLSIIILFFYFLKTKKVHKYLYFFIIIPFILLSVFLNDNGYYYEKENFQELLTDLNIIVDTPIEEDVVEEYDPVWEVGNYRGSLWIHGIKYSLEKPALGFGLENLEKRFEKDNIDIDHPHNLMINLADTVGIPGMLFYISGLIIILIKCIKNIKKESIFMNVCCFVLIAHLLSSMFGVTIYYVTVYFIIILGMTLKLLTDDK